MTRLYPDWSVREAAEVLDSFRYRRSLSDDDARRVSRLRDRGEHVEALAVVAERMDDRRRYRTGSTRWWR